MLLHRQEGVWDCLRGLLYELRHNLCIGRSCMYISPLDESQSTVKDWPFSLDRHLLPHLLHPTKLAQIVPQVSLSDHVLITAQIKRSLTPI